jgi:hypothetical protein
MHTIIAEFEKQNFKTLGALALPALAECISEAIPWVPESEKKN